MIYVVGGTTREFEDYVHERLHAKGAWHLKRSDFQRIQTMEQAQGIEVRDERDIVYLGGAPQLVQFMRTRIRPTCG